MNFRRWLAIALGLIVGAAVCAGAWFERKCSAERAVFEEVSLARAQAQHLQHQLILYSKELVPSGLPFHGALESMGINPLTSMRVAASAQSVFDFRGLRAGNLLEISKTVLGDLREVRYRIDPDRVLVVSRKGDDFHSEVQTIASRTDTVGVHGRIRDSLFASITDAGEKPELAMRLADIFGWDLDFYTDPRPGDTFRVAVEKKILADGEVAGYGRILSAEYDNDGRIYRAVLFHDPAGNPAYYTPDGKSLKKAFLHSPLKFAAPITSHFSYSRFHPILKKYRPHLGIDYGAPAGTPVQTIGDGRVVFAARKGEDGNLIKIQHANGYVTYYMHLSRILVHDGEHVAQGQRIGLVGMTGLATGPHLDFRIERHGQFLNFERLPLPPSEPVAASQWKAFAAARDLEIAQMPSLTPQPVLAANAPPAK